MNVSNYNLPNKFFPFLLGHPSCASNDIKNEIDQIMQSCLIVNLKNNVFDCGKWILKYPRTDGLPTNPDTHLYRVRKAEKIRNYIINNKLEAEFAVPKKFLYQLENKDYCVIAEKLELSQDVVSLYSDETRKGITIQLELVGQVSALAKGAKERPLTPTQAKALAELSILGYTDQTFNNFFFTRDGKVAIIDSEPLKRLLKKTIAASKINSFICDKSGMLTCHSVAGIAKLKQVCTDPEARKQVELVEKNHVLWAIAKLTLKVVLGCLVIYSIPRAISSLGLPSKAATLLRVSLRTVSVIKTIFLTLQVLSVSNMWFMSCNGDKGLIAIQEIEKKGGC